MMLQIISKATKLVSVIYSLLYIFIKAVKFVY